MHYLIVGLSLGLSAGLSPGPLMTLVVTTALRDGFWNGLRVAISPLLTDVPIILLAIFVLDRLPPWLLAIVGVIGSLYVIFLGWETIRSAADADLETLRAESSQTDNIGRQSFLRGAVVNALNPHPYLFWAAIGGPLLLTSYAQRPIYAAAFIIGFYTLLFGSKIGLAALVNSQAHLLSGPWYRRVLIALGLLLIGLGLWLGWQAATGSL